MWEEGASQWGAQWESLLPQWGDRELPSGEGAGAQWGRAASPIGAHIDPLGGSLGTPLGVRHLMCPSHLVGLTFLHTVVGPVNLHGIVCCESP